MVPYLSTADLGAELGTDVTGDPLAIIVLDSACQIVRSFLGRRLNYVKDDTVILDGTGSSVLLLPERPVEDVTAVMLDGETVTDYTLGKAGVLYSSFWTLGIGNVGVTYSHGYAVTETEVASGVERMPADIRSATLLIARRLYAMKGTIIGQLASETITPDSYAYTLSTAAQLAQSSAGLDASEMAILERHKELAV